MRSVQDLYLENAVADLSGDVVTWALTMFALLEERIEVISERSPFLSSAETLSLAE